MRLFVGVQIPDELRKNLASLPSELDRNSIRGVKEQNIHITIKFLGEVDEKMAINIEEKLEKANADLVPFKCSVKGVGTFPNESKARIIWVGTVSNGGLENLSEKISKKLQWHQSERRDQFDNDQKLQGTEKFTPHITIARVVRKLDVVPFIRKHKNELFGEFQVNGFDLIMSELGSGGPTYAVIKNYRIG